jgi:Niemann-Pick C1 protein
MVTYLLNNDDFTRSDAEDWEKNVFMKRINDFNVAQQKKLFTRGKKIILKVTYMAERSIPDEIKEETAGNEFVVVVSYLIMFVYISFGIGSVLVGISGIFIIIFSTTSAIGLTSYLGLRYYPNIRNDHD